VIPKLKIFTLEFFFSSKVLKYPDSSLSIVILEGANATLFLRPQINHFSDSNSPWVGENGSSIDSEETAAKFIRKQKN